MPDFARITINDAQGTPVAHNFDPVRIESGRAVFADRSAAVPAGFLTFSHEILEPTAQRQSYKMVNGFYLPVAVEVDGSYVVRRHNSTKLELNASPNSTLQERKDQYAYLQNLLANSDFKNSFLYFETFA
jgi:hypothetical protein